VWSFDKIYSTPYTGAMAKKAKKTKKPIKRVKKTARKKIAKPKRELAKTKNAAKPKRAGKRVVKKKVVVRKSVRAKAAKKRVVTKARRKRRIANPQDSLETAYRTKIRVVGIGGGGGNIVSEIATRVQKVDFLAANTDAQALREIPRKVRSFSFGQEFTGGLGCGMNPDLGEQSARAEKERIKKVFEGQDISILIASLGGGTGSGAALVFAEVAKEFKNLTLGIFTMPFLFEGEKRRQIAEQSLEQLKGSLNAYVVIPNENIFRVINNETSIKESFSAVNRRLADTIGGLIETIATAGVINIDFADVRATLDGRGKLAYINSATASGPTKVQQVLQEVLWSPISDYGIDGVERMLFNITGDKALKMQEVALISKGISDSSPRARIVFGISCTPKFKDKIRITLFAVGCKEGEEKVPRKENGEIKEKETVDIVERVEETKTISSKREKPAKKKSSVASKAAPVQKEKKRAKKRKKKAEEPARVTEPVRRNALDVKKAVDEEIKELEEQEKKWDIPAFLRNKTSL